MIQNVIRHLARVDTYGVLSLCIFGTIFIAVGTWALLQRKTHCEAMARKPLDNDLETLTNGIQSHE